MKQLSSFAILDIDGGDRVSYTFNEIDPDTGDPMSTNNKGNFYVVDPALAEHIDAIREHIRINRLEG